MSLLTCLFLSVWLQAPSPDVKVEAYFLSMHRLPPEVDYSILNSGFGVLYMKIRNDLSTPLPLDPDAAVLTDPKNKPVARAVPTEIAPKVVDKWSGGKSTLQTGQGRYIDPYGRRWSTGPEVTIGREEARVVHASKGQQIREILERYQLKKADLNPGEEIEVLLYFKTKKYPLDFVGAKLQLAPGVTTTVLPPQK